MKRAVKKKPKNVTHIIGALVKLRREIPDKKQFCTHISSARVLGSGVGLVLWQINKIKKKSDDGGWQFNLGCRYAEKLCPRKRGDKLVTQLMMEAGIIALIRPGIKGLTPALYRLCDDWVGIPPPGFKLNEWQLNRRAIASEKSRQNQYTRRPWLRWLDESLSRVVLPESDALRLAMQNPDTEPSARGSMDFLRGYLPPHERKATLAKYVGTVYTPISSLPSEVVPTLLIDGEAVSQLDISSAHPSTIPRILIEAELKYGVVGGIAEAKRLTEALESGRLYNSLAPAIGIAPNAAKHRLLSALNGKDPHAYNDAVFKEFTKLFPLVKVVFRMIRKRDRNDFNRKMAGILAEVMDLTAETCAKMGFPVFPRTDEIVCRQRDEAKVHEILSAYFLDQTSVHALVGGRRVSFIPSQARTD